MRRIIQSFLILLASSSRQELAAQNRLLKAENQILRSKLPKRIEFTPKDREKILKHGKPLGGKIRQLLTIISNSTFRRWVRESEDGTAKPKKTSSKGGRPRIEEPVSSKYSAEHFVRQKASQRVCQVGYFGRCDGHLNTRDSLIIDLTGANAKAGLRGFSDHAFQAATHR